MAVYSGSLQQEDIPSLYQPQLERGSCGVGFIADFEGRQPRTNVCDALGMLERMEHRGATGADSCCGDGAGILVRIPHLYFKRVLSEEGVELPDFGKYSIVSLFLPQEEDLRNKCLDIVKSVSPFTYLLLQFQFLRPSLLLAALSVMSYTNRGSLLPTACEHPCVMMALHKIRYLLFFTSYPHDFGLFLVSVCCLCLTLRPDPRWEPVTQPNPNTLTLL